MIGVISDTHDNLNAIDKAVELLNSKGVELVIHAGDFVSPFTVSHFEKLDAKLIAVFGNNDGEKKGLANKFSDIGVDVDYFAEVEHLDKKIAVYHGSIESIVEALIKSKKYDIVVRGHTHRAEVRREEGVLIINPGEVCGYLTGKRTVCLVDAEKLDAKILEI